VISCFFLWKISQKIILTLLNTKQGQKMLCRNEGAQTSKSRATSHLRDLLASQRMLLRPLNSDSSLRPCGKAAYKMSLRGLGLRLLSEWRGGSTPPPFLHLFHGTFPELEAIPKIVASIPILLINCVGVELARIQ
jgi:hypothetical protein